MEGVAEAAAQEEVAEQRCGTGRGERRHRLAVALQLEAAKQPNVDGRFRVGDRFPDVWPRRWPVYGPNRGPSTRQPVRAAHVMREYADHPSESESAIVSSVTLPLLAAK